MSMIKGSVRGKDMIAVMSINRSMPWHISCMAIEVIRIRVVDGHTLQTRFEDQEVSELRSRERTAETVFAEVGVRRCDVFKMIFPVVRLVLRSGSETRNRARPFCMLALKKNTWRPPSRERIEELIRLLHGAGVKKGDVVE